MIRHIPVLLQEVLKNLNLRPGIRVVDCTLGDGGHSEAMIAVIAGTGRLLGIDADPESLLRAKQYLYNYSEQVIFVRDNFVNLTKILTENNFSPVDAILLDLGWSSPQFSERGRGFSFEMDESLDMRFGGALSDVLTAADIVNNYSVDELYKIFHNFGEEKFAREIAQAIIEKRKIERIGRTGQLVAVVLEVYRDKLHSEKEIPWVGGTHPATQIFQALRIAVNDELGVLKKVLPQAIDALGSGGRLAVISFHSLEDRVVKQYFAGQENKTVKLINKKPIEAADEEIKSNPRSRSAKLRVVEKI